MLRCDLHRHAYGSVQPAWWLPRLVNNPADLSAYERAYDQAFGRDPGLRAVLGQLRSGATIDHCLPAFERLFTLRRGDGSGFERFQAKHDLLTWSSALADPQLAQRPTARASDELQALCEHLFDQARSEGLRLMEWRIMLPAALRPAVARWIYQTVSQHCQRLSTAQCTMQVVVSLPRNQALAAWQTLAAALIAGEANSVVAVDLCHREERSDPLDLLPLAETIRAFNAEHPQLAVALLVHVGESFETISLESALRRVDHAASQLGAHRLGHALAAGLAAAHFGPHRRHESAAERLRQIDYDLQQASALRHAGVIIDEDALRDERRALQGQDPRRRLPQVYDEQRLSQWQCRQHWLCEQLQTRATIIEVCPTSNLLIAGLRDPAHHPIHTFLEHGVRCVLGSDDPGLLASSLPNEIHVIDQWCGKGQGAGLADSYAWRSEVLSGRTGQIL